MINAGYARLLHRDLVALGVPEETLLAGTGLTAHQIWNAKQLPPREFVALLENARALRKEPALGFRLAGQNRLAGLGMMGLAMVSAPTLGDGLQAMASFTSLEAGYIKFNVAAGPTYTAINILIDDVVGASLDLHVESILGLIQAFIEDTTGPLENRAVFTVSYPDEGRSAEYAEYLHGRIEFNQPVNSISIPTRLLNNLSPFADAEVWVMTRRFLSEKLSALDGEAKKPFTEHTRGVLSAAQPPLPDIRAIADSLHVSQRTLNRRLHDEGNSFRQLKLDATHNWSRRMLLEGASAEAIALELGYNNAANFRRSFRECFGKAPREWLNEQQDQLSRGVP